MQINASYSVAYSPVSTSQPGVKKESAERDLSANSGLTQEPVNTQFHQALELPIDKQVQVLEKNTESQAAKASHAFAVNTNPAVAKYLDNQYAEKNLSNELSGIDIFV